MPAAALFPADIFPESELLPALLDLSLTGIVAYTPIADASGAVVDLAFAYLNPAAQRIIGLPARPAVTYLARFPNSVANGAFAFHCAALRATEPQQIELKYEADGYDTYFRVAARRLGGGLLVSFADTGDFPRSAAEEALRASQAREQQARAEAERQQAILHHVLMQAPAMICIFEGPSHRFQLVNGPYQALVGERPLLGKPIAEAMPELAGQPIFDLLDNVYRTGEPFLATEMLVQLDHDNSHPTALDERYYNFTYQARRDLQGQIDGILVFAYEVTAQVQARRLVEDTARQLSGLNHQLDISNEELAATNEELQASNEEFLTNNTELARTQLALRRLNEELEARVEARSREVQAALRVAEQQREQLRTQQRLLRQILGQVPAAIATLTGPEHCYSFFNDNYLTLTGGRAQLGLPVADMLPEVAQQGFVRLLDQVRATGRAYVGTETPLQLHDAATGQLVQRYLDFVYQPILDAQGRVQDILAFLVDATEKVRARQQATALQAELQAELLAAAQRQAQERENLYQIFEQTPAIIGLLRGPEHRVDYINPAFRALFPGRALLGLPIAASQPEAVAQGFTALLDHVYRTGETYFGTEQPLVLEPPAGQAAETRFFNFTYQAYREQGEIVGISVFTYDVTAQVLARREADQQRELLHTLFMDAPAPIAILDGPSYVYQLVNPAYQQIFPGRALAGRPVFEALPELADTAVPELLRHVYTTGEPFVAQELPLELARHDGAALERLHFNFTYQPRYNSRNQIDGILVFAYEVTEQVRARQTVEENRQQAQALADELAATNQRLRRTNADLDTFVYTASHDLKSPIANLEGLFTALREQLPPESLQAPLVPRLLEMMDGAVLRFRETLTHLTDVSKLQPDADGAPAEVVDLAALLRAVRLDLAADLAAAGATLTVDLAGPPTARFSPKNLRSIVYNLLSNAIKYRDPARPALVQLRGRHANGQLVLEVQDNGLGLDAGQQGKLFGMFRRLHTHVEGSGVGLYMVKRLVENAGGQIHVASQPGVGSIFSVSLPA
ncbi:PAS domain-containing protein [Hymenobacter cheonanensis]|uniref:PAS domain-containing protein n=1 Tax=Hymenobacter sp. CA2-7 TaxID=3063993 RepID=UPI0027125300|nr:PAS domain-containing protein [Hymenobacter sp. CA2-7]MDO7884584.1 PAS domain-containing protein [Hymenobacter sp. CA2-7]